ncbi:uncharacterized protein MELLADRAFT_92336 [Melampsora larici-populina 98AG31]|uniref:Alpha-type protein kinase domain-containing protein n=1 Tax=Melampsora larici-populina (strain 98AG31 / pathotype 3-4-7) TaxID=747676 RepID=F4R991_MELLP|nr:uncharacterized protein MELLADRAFT_92336 [Melampsora larici-populina 98AG31]EGG10943.1 hypothetical protein MELLADRAFT_92336 [Melampsora larici-populina 98AG31]
MSREHDHMSDQFVADDPSSLPHEIRTHEDDVEGQVVNRSPDRARKPSPIAVDQDKAYGDDDNIIDTSFQPLDASDQADISMSTLSSKTLDGSELADISISSTGHIKRAAVVPYYEYIEDLSSKEEGYIYRLKPKKIKDNANHYDQYEDVNQIEDRIGFRGYSLIKAAACKDEDWVVRWIYIYHREISGWYHLKFHNSWDQMASQGHAHCFERALNNRYVEMALRSFIHDLFKKMDGGGHLEIDPVIQLWHQGASAMKVSRMCVMQSSGSPYDDEPRWKIIEEQTAVSHRYICKDNYYNPPARRGVWSDLIYAFHHYTYDFSASQTLIANLDCDRHGHISNVVCLDKKSTPYHSCENPSIADNIKRAFRQFAEQHECNEICEVLGNVALGKLDASENKK